MVSSTWGGSAREHQRQRAWPPTGHTSYTRLADEFRRLSVTINLLIAQAHLHLSIQVAPVFKIGVLNM